MNELILISVVVLFFILSFSVVLLWFHRMDKDYQKDYPDEKRIRK